MISSLWFMLGVTSVIFMIVAAMIFSTSLGMLFGAIFNGASKKDKIEIVLVSTISICLFNLFGATMLWIFKTKI